MTNSDGDEQKHPREDQDGGDTHEWPGKLLGDSIRDPQQRETEDHVQGRKPRTDHQACTNDRADKSYGDENYGDIAQW